jgi:hypothetical protein
MQSVEWDDSEGEYNIKTQSVIPVVTADLLENHPLTPYCLTPSIPSSRATQQSQG